MRALLLTLAVALPVAGCAGTDGGSPPASSSPASSTPSRVSPPAGITVDGVVEKGVQPGCLVLRAGTRNYLLLQGADPVSATGVPVGVPVRVTGELLTGVASYCQQGAPLRVLAVARR